MEDNLITFYKDDDNILTLLNEEKLNKDFTIRIDSSTTSLYKEKPFFIPDINIMYKRYNKREVYINFKDFNKISILDYGYKELPIQIILKCMIFVIDVYEKINEMGYHNIVPVLNFDNIINIGKDLKVLKFKQYNGHFLYELGIFLINLFTLSNTKSIKYNKEDPNELYIVDLIKFSFVQQDKHIRLFKGFCGHLLYTIFQI